jgi:hypothetical protein
MWVQKGKTKNLHADAFMAGSAKTIQISRGGIADAALQEIFAKIRTVTKIQIPFLYWGNPVKENRQLEKLNYRVGLVSLADAPG